MSPAARYAFYLRRAREALICARAWRRLGQVNMAAKWLTYAGDLRRLAIQAGQGRDTPPLRSRPIGSARWLPAVTI